MLREIVLDTETACFSDTSRGLLSAQTQVRSILAAMAGRPGRVMSLLPKD
jgi:hypothetical protein